MGGLRGGGGVRGGVETGLLKPVRLQVAGVVGTEDLPRIRGIHEYIYIYTCIHTYIHTYIHDNIYMYTCPVYG